MGDIKIPVSQEGSAKMVESLTEGYGQYVKDHPEADYSGLQEDFREYLQTDAAQKRSWKTAVQAIIRREHDHHRIQRTDPDPFEKLENRDLRHS